MSSRVKQCKTMNMSRPGIIIVLISIICCLLVDAFNLSPLANQVFQMPNHQRTFNEQLRSSYFGYSINLRKDGLMVAAPRAETTQESQRKINETGAIYKCSFAAGGGCSPFIFDQLGNVESKNKNGYFQSRLKDNQWLGMSMDGAGEATDKFIVCAPMMKTPTSDGEHYLLHGICYVTMQGTEGDRPADKVVELIPLQRANRQVDKTPDGESKLVYMYGELGLSVHITENNEEILIGAPGVSHWKGTVVRYRPIDGADNGGLSKRDNTVREKRNTNDDSEIEYDSEVPLPEKWNQTDDSYFGYAVTSGYFDGPAGRILYAGSAPHAGVGEVYVFDMVADGQTVGEKVIRKLAILGGKQIGEFFGYTILAEDFNNDGYADLVVGAPSHSFDGYHEQGCIYYYQNLGATGQYDFELKATLSPTENQNIDSRFGMTLGKIGDLDMDGFKDLAVGAPFENDGAVYIFSGSPDGLRIKETQRIANSAPNDKANDGELSMFGMSISRGVDMDGNGYNGEYLLLH